MSLDPERLTVLLTAQKPTIQVTNLPSLHILFQPQQQRAAITLFRHIGRRGPQHGVFWGRPQNALIVTKAA